MYKAAGNFSNEKESGGAAKSVKRQLLIPEALG
jgi:hypothetical protein